MCFSILKHCSVRAVCRELWLLIFGQWITKLPKNLLLGVRIDFYRFCFSHKFLAKTFSCTCVLSTSTLILLYFAQLASPFAIRRPYDLLALMEQETRRNNIIAIYKDLIARKESIEKKWAALEGRSSTAEKFTRFQECSLNGKYLPDVEELDLDSHIVMNGSDREGIKFNFSGSKAGDVKTFKVPDCTKYSKLDFSVFAYEHFVSMRKKSSLNISAEESLIKLMPIKSVKLFGHEIVLGLQKNKTSWLHYNLGALYWRIKGNGTKSVECSRRALHFVPR